MLCDRRRVGMIESHFCCYDNDTCHSTMASPDIAPLPRVESPLWRHLKSLAHLSGTLVTCAHSPGISASASTAIGKRQRMPSPGNSHLADCWRPIWRLTDRKQHFAILLGLNNLSRNTEMEIILPLLESRIVDVLIGMKETYDDTERDEERTNWERMKKAEGRE